MPRMTVEYEVNCKRCGEKIGYSGMMYEKIKEFGQSRPEYCEKCRAILILEKMTMGAAYFSVKTLPGADMTIAIPGTLGMVYHPQRPHIRKENPDKFDASKFGATAEKIVELYEWLKDKDHQYAIIVGATGSGKSSALPYWMVYPPKGVPEDFFIRDGQIMITQPRILATTSLSDFLGVLMGSSVGKGFDVGYRYSKDRNADRFNAVFLATDGTLINMIKNGQLADLSVLVIDEAHERSLNIDVILRLLRDQLPLYPHLKVLIVSATINKELFVNFFGPKNAKVIEFEAKRKFDYKVFFASEAEKLPYDNPRLLKKVIVAGVAKKVCWLLKEEIEGRKTRGHILAFLQGEKPIQEAVSIIRKYVEADPKLKDVVEVFPLYSSLPEDQANWAMKGKDERKIRVVVCTNVAEASVTVEGAVHEVETGIENQARWNIEEEEKRIELNYISQANAQQRWGRLGRTAPGEVHCLYTKAQYQAMIPFPIPAIQRSSMDEIVLLLKDLGIDELEEGWLQDPVKEEMGRSYKSLQGVGAIDSDGMLTEYGAMLREFSYSATLTDLIVLSDRFGCATEIATILPVIKNGGHIHLLVSDPDWDLKTKKRVEAIHGALWKDCRDDVEFILKLYQLWSNPPDLKKNEGKNLSLKERREAWAEEFFINNDVFAEEVEVERTQILQLLSAHKHDKNLREINLAMIPRARIILTFCVPFAPVEEKYSFKQKGDFQVGLPDEDSRVITEQKEKKSSWMSFARNLIGVESRPYDGLERINKEPLLSADDYMKGLSAEWQKIIANDFPVGKIALGTIKTVSDAGATVILTSGENGFVHVGKIGGSHKINSALEVFKNGDAIYVKVIGYNPERMQLLFSTAIVENSPLRTKKPGQIIQGKVISLTDFGAFVDVGMGYAGMIHVSKFGRRINKPADMVAIGNIVKVEVLEVREEKGAIRVALRFLEVLGK